MRFCRHFCIILINDNAEPMVLEGGFTMKKNGIWKKIAVAVSAAVLSAASVMSVWAAAERLDTVENTYWDEEDDTIARWDAVENAYEYEVYLYRNEQKTSSIRTKKDYYNFKKKMTAEGDYTFKVRALAKERSRNYRDGYWSEESDTCYISADYAEILKSGGEIDTDHSGPGVSGSSSAETTGTDKISVVYTAQWIPTEDGRWWYRNSDGSYPVGGWWKEPGTEIWYYFDAEGYMKTGWIEENGVKYYCQPSGAMVTGEQTIEGVLYHFDGSGALQPS